MKKMNRNVILLGLFFVLNSVQITEFSTGASFAEKIKDIDYCAQLCSIADNKYQALHPILLYSAFPK